MTLMMGLTLGLTGCSTDWIGQAEQIVAAMIPAAANLLTLVVALEGKTVSAGDLQLIQSTGTQAGADLQLIQSLVAAYQKADAATKPGIVGQIESAIGAAQGSLAALLPALHIKDEATQAKITAVVGILLSEVESLAAVVPLVNSSGTPQGMRKNAAVLSVKAPLSAGEFVNSYNATMTAKTGNLELDRATAGLRIHEHGKVERWVSAGVVK
jgi:hypothetical protein